MNGGVKVLKLKFKSASLSEPVKQPLLPGDDATGKKRRFDELPGSEVEESAEYQNSAGAPPGYASKRPASLLTSVLSIPNASGVPNIPRPTINLKFPSPAARGQAASGQKPPRGRGHGSRAAAAEPTSSAELTSPRGRGRRGGRGGGRGRRGGGAGRGRGRQRRSRKSSPVDDEEDEPDEIDDEPDVPTPTSTAPPEPKPVLKMKISHAVAALQAPAPAAAAPPPQPKNMDKADLLRVIDHIQKKDKDQIFKAPVTDDVAPGYSDLIKQPMDFSTIRNKVANGTYTSWELLGSDLELMFNNAMIYNGAGTIFYREARMLLAVSNKVLELAREGVRNFRGRTNGVIRAQNAQNLAEDLAVKEAQKNHKTQKAAGNANPLAAVEPQDDAAQDEGGAGDHPRARNTARPMVKENDGRRPLMLDENLRTTYRPRYMSMGQSAAAWGGLAGGASAEGCTYAAGRPVLKQVPNAPPDALLHSVARFIANCSDTVKEHVLGTLLECVAVDLPRPKLSLPSQIPPPSAHHQPPAHPQAAPGPQIPPTRQQPFPPQPLPSVPAALSSQPHQHQIHQQPAPAGAPSHRSITSAATSQQPADLQLQLQQQQRKVLHQQLQQQSQPPLPQHQQHQPSQSSAYINALRQNALAQQAAAVAALQPNLSSSQGSQYQALQAAPINRQFPAGPATMQSTALLQSHQPSIANQTADNRLQQLISAQQQQQLQAIAGELGPEQVRISSQQGLPLHLPTAQQQPPQGVPGQQLSSNTSQVMQYLQQHNMLPRR